MAETKRDRATIPFSSAWMAARKAEWERQLARRRTRQPHLRLKLQIAVQSDGQVAAHAKCGPDGGRHLRRCVDLGERIEVRAGCASGWMCRHECRSRQRDVMEHLGEVPEAVPGDDCQDCPGFVDAGRF
ncbi:MAG: hypothetical protein JNK93_06575 [Planctomycetia bacterium]|nr:hypothetical protein [Planctomycetia bacterium]